MSKKYIILMLAFFTLRINSFDLLNQNRAVDPQERREARRMDIAKLLAIIAIVVTVDTVVTQLYEGPSGKPTSGLIPAPTITASASPTTSPSATATPDVRREAEKIRQELLKSMRESKLELAGQRAEITERTKRQLNGKGSAKINNGGR